jgi:hypothetical protein
MLLRCRSRIGEARSIYDSVIANLWALSGPLLHGEKSKMITTRRMAALTALTCLALGGGAKGDITYNIVDYPSITNPYTVSWENKGGKISGHN